MRDLKRMATRLLRAANGNDLRMVVHSHRDMVRATPAPNEPVLLKSGNYHPYVWDLTADIEALRAARAEQGQ